MIKKAAIAGAGSYHLIYDLKEIEEKVADPETGARLSDLENLPFTQVSFT